MTSQSTWLSRLHARFGSWPAWIGVPCQIILSVVVIVPTMVGQFVWHWATAARGTAWKRKP